MSWEYDNERDRRQELRHRGDQEEVPRHMRVPKKTKKWCGGKEGVKHIWSRQYPYSWSTKTAVDICDKCGKHGKYYWAGWGE